MSLRARIFIIISVCLLLVLAVSIFLIVKNKNSAGSPATNNSASTANTNQNNADNNQIVNQTPPGLPAKTLSPLEVEQNGVQQLAKIFVERYGTYSTDNDFSNIKESQALVTKSLWSKISVGINEKNVAQTFLGLTTKVISVSLTAWTEDKATVALKTMRVENKNGVISTRYQNVTVGMVKSNGVWLADTIVWN